MKRRSMSRDFKDCLDKKKLYRSDAAKSLAGKELKSAADDLAEAELSLAQRRYKWASHFCVLAGIEHLFGETKLLDLKWVRAVRNAMSLREDADYSDSYSCEGAGASVKNATVFLQEAKRILDQAK